MSKVIAKQIKITVHNNKTLATRQVTIPEENKKKARLQQSLNLSNVKQMILFRLLRNFVLLIC